ncbi:unnamed protein product [Clonostachys chloroleuca]|uniref:C2H2-type domain-containing protein n=1 Tax=Clonostachys chloroleuca TaxID=1926264 RepID=A0AA35QE01_9HYPO|nr:unnamed protein product [Clonostachys chloroleuca]
MHNAAPGMESHGGQFGSQDNHFEDALPIPNLDRRDGSESMQNWLAKDAPWAPSTVFSNGTVPYLRTSPAFHGYRSNIIPSDCGETQPDDSGYGKSIETTSIRGDDHYPSALGFENDLGGLHLVAPEALDQQPGSQFSADTLMSPDGLTCDCCNKTFKNKSELKKHCARKSRPFTCDRNGCSKSQVGFASNNDLVRHKRTVHGDNLKGRTYICTNGDCAKETPPKKWPRTDNFRSHLKRVHKIEQVGDMDLQRYLYEPIPEDLQGLGAKLHEPSTLHTESLFAGAPHTRAEHIAEFANTDAFPAASETPLYTPDGSLEGINPYSGNGFLEVPQDDSFGSHMNPAAFGSHPSAESFPRSITPSSMMSTGAKVEPSESAYEANLGSQESVSSESVADGEQFAALDDDDENEKGGVEINEDKFEEYFSSLPQAKKLDFLASVPATMLQAALRQKEEAPETDASQSSAASIKGKVECNLCGKVFVRPCELRKHSKRHEKPYGCTVYQCEKTFGSKNDWKRHEGQQHTPLETWACDRSCGKVFGSRDQFNLHLEGSHPEMSPPTKEAKLEDNRQNMHSMSSFWCGFCRCMVAFASDTTDPQGVRFDHIDDHFMGRREQPKMNISEWLHMEIAHAERKAPAKRASNKEGNMRKRKLSAASDARPSKQPHTSVV